MQGGVVYKVQKKSNLQFFAAKIYFTREQELINLVNN